MPDPLTTVKTLREFAGDDWIDDGYEFMEAGRTEGWQVISAWGEDGWDLGDWPYVVYLFRERAVPACAVCSTVLTAREILTLSKDHDFVPHGDPGHLIRVASPVAVVYEVADYCEGDITVRTFSTLDDRQETIDIEAVWRWIGDPDRHGLRADLDGLDRDGLTVDKIPARLRGPYGKQRERSTT